MEQYKAIFFDWDGTLVETTDIIMDAHNHVRNFFGLAPFEDESFRRGHQSTRELYPTLYGDKAQEAEKVLYEFFEENHLKALRAYPDSTAMLESLGHFSIPAALVSNKKHNFLELEVKELGWGTHFDFMVGAGEASKDKPDPAPLYMAVENMPHMLNITDILYVGDTETDMKAAQAAGCSAALIRRGRAMDDIIEEYKPAYVFDTLAEFQTVLETAYTAKQQKNTC
jgi:phosphoglycolate phosphatase